MDYRQEMKELRDTLNAHGYRYYVLDEPTISDYEYDHMLRRLEDLEAAHPEEITPDSPTQRIGGRTLSEFQQVTHPVPLESLQDVFNDDEVCQFLEKIPLDAPVWSVEPKVDGLSVALEYRDGVFVRGAPRGDGRGQPRRAAADDGQLYLFHACTSFVSPVSRRLPPPDLVSCVWGTPSSSDSSSMTRGAQKPP